MSLKDNTLLDDDKAETPACSCNFEENGARFLNMNCIFIEKKSLSKIVNVLQGSLSLFKMTKKLPVKKEWGDPYSKYTSLPSPCALCENKSTTAKFYDWKQCEQEDKVILSRLRSLQSITNATKTDCVTVVMTPDHFPSKCTLIESEPEQELICIDPDYITIANFGKMDDVVTPSGNPQLKDRCSQNDSIIGMKLVAAPPRTIRLQLPMSKPANPKIKCQPIQDNSLQCCRVDQEVGRPNTNGEKLVISRRVDKDASDLGSRDNLVLLKRTSSRFGVHSLPSDGNTSRPVASNKVERTTETERNKTLIHQPNPLTSNANDLRGAHSQFEPGLVQPLTHQHSKIELILKLVRDLLHAQNYYEIVQIVEDILKDLENATPNQRVQLYFILALAYYKLGKHRNAMEHFKQAESVRPIKKGDVAMCNIYLGDIHFARASYHRASECYTIAVMKYDPDNLAPMFKMIPPTLSAIHAKCGSCFRHVSKSFEAINEYKTAIDVATIDKDRLSAHTSLGNLYQSLGQNDEALPQYEASIELAEKIPDYIALGWSHGNIGNAYLGLYQKDKALFHLQKSLDLTVKHEPTPAAIGRAYNNIGTAYQSLGDLDKAEEFYDLSLSQAIYGNDIPGQARVYGNIGNVLMIRKDYERAIPHYSEVLRLAKDSSTISTARHNRGCAYYEWAESKMASLEGLNSLTPEFHAPRAKGPEPAVRAKGVDPKAAKVPPEPLQVALLDKASTTIEPTLNYHVHAASDDYRRSHKPRLVIDSIAGLYRQGMSDLREVVAQHESKFDNIKGSSKGLSLSVSLFESNSRTFHRLQDCLVGLGNWKEGLLVAEQSRARTLGELMLSRKARQLQNVLTTPLNLDHISTIVVSQNSPVLYLSYTGARLLGWVLLPQEDRQTIAMEMFEVPLADDQFDGKSFDYHLRYRLTEELVEKSYEMYQSITYNDNSSAPVQDLYNLIAKPLLEILNTLNYVSTCKKLILITDTYTTFVPFVCLRDPEKDTFLGDDYQLQLMPSLLTMGVMNQLPEAIVTLPADTRSMCVVGNPTIPAFYYNDSQWNLGKLPHAKREALWVGHILTTTPILEEQATKNAVMMRIMSAQVIHIATHGSASAGFLAFASSSTINRPGVVVSAVQVLLHPEEVEKLSISPALVVLSSCDSGRGVVKADGIQGMARAFILAGAQAVLSTLWRAPDESTAVFMRFFYRYLVEGFESTLALQKSILSLRCFSKYSQYIHWSGYQLTGRTIRLEMKSTPLRQALNIRLGPSTAFPRLWAVKKLQAALVDNPRTPTDIQILRGSPGVKPSEVAIDFIHTSHEHFTAGILWINCRRRELIEASVKSIEKTIGHDVTKLQLTELRQALFVLDSATELPQLESLLQVFRNIHVHVILLSKCFESPDNIVREVDKILIRGCNIYEIKTLSKIESTQRTVHRVLKEHHLAPTNKDQKMFEMLAEFTSGSPVIVDVASQVLLKFFRETPDDPSLCLENFADAICLTETRTSGKVAAAPRQMPTQAAVRAVSINLTKLSPSIATTVPSDCRDVWESNTEYDSWDSIGRLLKCCLTLPEEMLLLRSLSMFSCSPIPIYLVTELSSLISLSSKRPHLAGLLHKKLLDMMIIKTYPLPVVYHPNAAQIDPQSDPQYVYVPQHISRSLWKCLTDEDRVVSLAVMHRTFVNLLHRVTTLDAHFLLGLCSLLLEMIDFNFELIGKKCYQEVYEVYLGLLDKVSKVHTHFL